MTQFKEKYTKLYENLSDDDQIAFDSLNQEFDKNHVTQEAKYKKLYELVRNMIDNNQNYIDYYNQKTRVLAKNESKELEKIRGNFWIDVTILLFYFAVLYIAMTFFIGEIVLSYSVVLALLLIFVMVPFMNHGIKHQASGRGSHKTGASIIFLLLFVITNCLIIFMSSSFLQVLFIDSFDVSLVDSLLFGLFIIIAAAALYFILSSSEWSTKIIFIIILIYSLGRILYPLDVLNGLATFIVKYFMYIGLVIIVLMQLYRSRKKNR